MKKLILILSMLIVSYAGIAQEVQTFVSENLTVMKLNKTTDEWDIISTNDQITSITYGPKFVQIGSNPKTKYVLYGEIEKTEDKNATFYSQSGFAYNGVDMKTWTIYGKNQVYVKIGILIGEKMFLFRLQNPYK